MTLALSCLAAQDAVACRGIRNWPRNEHDPRLRAEDVVVRASLLRAYESKHAHGTIMGSDLDFVYRIKVDAVLKRSDASIRPGDYLHVENPGDVCEFYRPWPSFKAVDVGSASSKKIVLRYVKHDGGAWNIIGGE